MLPLIFRLCCLVLVYFGGNSDQAHILLTSCALHAALVLPRTLFFRSCPMSDIIIKIGAPAVSLLVFLCPYFGYGVPLFMAFAGEGAMCACELPVGAACVALQWLIGGPLFGWKQFEAINTMASPLWISMPLLGISLLLEVDTALYRWSIGLPIFFGGHLLGVPILFGIVIGAIMLPVAWVGSGMYLHGRFCSDPVDHHIEAAPQADGVVGPDCTSAKGRAGLPDDGPPLVVKL